MKEKGFSINIIWITYLGYALLMLASQGLIAHETVISVSKFIVATSLVLTAILMVVAILGFKIIKRAPNAPTVPAPKVSYRLFLIILIDAAFLAVCLRNQMDMPVVYGAMALKWVLHVLVLISRKNLNKK